MTVERVATNAQSQLMLSQIMQSENALNKSQAQVTTGKVATDYAGIGDKTAVLEATRSLSERTTAYQSATTAASTQVDLQNTQLSTLSDLANTLRTDITTAVANNDGSQLMNNAQSVMDQLNQVLNSKDANGNYIYGGDNNDQPPVTVSSLSDLTSLSNVSQAFQNGTKTSSVMVADGQSVQVGVLASDVGSQMMQTLKDIADYVNTNGSLTSDMTSTQSNFLSGEIQSATDAGTQVNAVASTNGSNYQALQNALTTQTSMSTTYKGFVSDLENVDMATAITNLNQNQVALQAAMEVTSQIGQISLLNYLPASGTVG
ncbi:MAG TPA: flagellin [Rhizomicrobium sp.]|jgi:flagellar hook-associated protein 3 FlgL|nr:flagellin [Rhizomicrobium sp.]